MPLVKWHWCLEEACIIVAVCMRTEACHNENDEMLRAKGYIIISNNKKHSVKRQACNLL